MNRKKGWIKAAVVGLAIIAVSVLTLDFTATHTHASGGPAYKSGTIAAKGLVLGDSGKPIWAEFNAQGEVVREIGEAVEDLENAFVMPAAAYRAYVAVFEAVEEEHSANRRIMYRDEYQLTDFSLANGSAIDPPPLKDNTYSVVVRTAEVMYTDSVPLVLHESPLDLLRFQSIPDSARAVLLGADRRVIATADVNIGYVAAFYTPEGGQDESKGRSSLGGYRPGQGTLWGPVAGAKVETSLSRFPAYSDENGHYVVPYFIPPCPGFAMDYNNNIFVQLRYQHFDPKRRSPFGTWYEWRQGYDYCVGYSEGFFGASLAGLAAKMSLMSIEAGMAQPINRVDFSIDVAVLTGQAFMRNQSRPGIPVNPGVVGTIPMGGTTRYSYTVPDFAPKETTLLDLDGDGNADTVELWQDENDQYWYKVWLGDSDPAVDGPDLKRLADFNPDLFDRGLLKQISKDDLENTDFYVYRNSNGQLVTSREGLRPNESNPYYGGSASDENESIVNYRMLMRGPASFNYLRPLKFEDWQVATNIHEELQGRKADHLRVGEQVKVIMINRATGYMGSAIGTFGENLGSGLISFSPESIVMRPPNLKIKTERTYDIQSGLTVGTERQYIIGFEGSGLTSDKLITITTEWVDWDGSPLPEDLPGYTGRLAKVVEENVLGPVSGQIANFDIKPGRHIQLVQLPQADIDNSHYYIHVSGEPLEGNPNFSGSVFDSTGAAGEGALQYRPDRYVPLKTPVYDEDATWAGKMAYRKAIKEGNTDLEEPEPFYHWVYRPEMQFSLFELEKMELVDDEGKTYNIETPGTGNSSIPISFNFFYTLLEDSFPMLTQFGPERELIFSIGAEEILAITMGEDHPLEFLDTDSLDLLEADDYLALKLYQNGDSENILWQYLTAYVDIDIDSDNDNRLHMPTRSETEDEIEDISGQADNPGKFISVNIGDEDEDTVPNYADGFNKFGNEGINAGGLFTPFIVEFDESLRFDKARVKFTYADSDPDGVVRTGEGTDEDPYSYAPAPGHLRLWKRDGNEDRNKAEVDSGGDYIKSGSEYLVSDLGSGPVIVLYAEGIDASSNLADQRIKVEVDANGGEEEPGFIIADAVRITLLKIEFVRGNVEAESGRGMIGSAAEVLSDIKPFDVLPASDPVPLVKLESVVVENIRENEEDRLVADISVSGYATFSLADIVPDNEADLTNATIVVAEKEVASINLNRVSQSQSLLRPYAAKYTFNENLSGVPIVLHNCGILVRIQDQVTGSIGQASGSFTVSATGYSSSSDNGEDDFNIQKSLNQPVLLKIDLGGEWTYLQDLANTLEETISVSARRTFIDNDPILTESTKLIIDADGKTFLKSSDGSIEIEIEDVSQFGLENTVQGEFTASVRIPDKYWEPFTVRFRETAADSNIYANSFVDVRVSIDGTLNEYEIDTISVELRENTFDAAGTWIPYDLTETDTDTLEFGNGSFGVTIVDLQQLCVCNEMTVSITNATLNLVEHLVDLTDESGIFTTDQVFNGCTCIFENEYSTALLNGPWNAGNFVHHDSINPGVYVPLLVRIIGPPEIVDLGMKINVFGQDHELVEYEDLIFSAGSSSPGNFAMVGNLEAGTHFGAGHITKDEGFEFTTLDGSLRGSAAHVHRGVTKLFDELKTVADSRRAERFGIDPGDSYWPPTYSSANDPVTTFAEFIWNKYFLEALIALGRPITDPIDDAVRRRALQLMTQNDPRISVIGIPNAPDHLYYNARISSVLTIGSKYLIGHWKNTSTDQQNDFGSQRQNVTDILHFNSGLGWGIIEPVISSLQTILDATYATEDKKAQAIMDWMRSNGFLNALSPTARNYLARYGDISAFKYAVKDNRRWKELVDIMTMAKAFGGSSVSSLDFFMAYDIASGEAFHVYGLDPFNDVIATEAGAGLGRELASPGSSIDSPDKLKERIEFHMNSARSAFLSHTVFANKPNRLKAFRSVMLANNGWRFIPVEISFPVDVSAGGIRVVIWQETLGTICQKNRSKLVGVSRTQDFVDKVVELMKNRSVPSYSGPEADLSPEDIKSLHVIVDMLSLLNQ